eukprot:CAMPEP_0113610690 /NCGR_PEP_ID=MMETSP0017_2-20120614/5158_1 /TAXON_ID=2856 /ORGANISM="Cylindrotheca closterium" /LENGTH=186 /DNA_ID=CAMNT_0000519589 /DNA_START=42 /DNA_END=602 /DNA_ORIENTATION=+ /assembly_acc=CAM_ASM_000147
MPPSASSQQTNSSLPTSSKIISFSENITSIPQSEPHNANDTWYTNHELKAIRRQASLVVSAMRCSSKKTFGDNELVCTYGLSHHVRKDIVKIRKAVALSIVLEEQSVQTQASKTVVLDHDWIANIYFEVTKRNQLVATLRGKQLALEVRSMWSPSSTKSQDRRLFLGSPLESTQKPRMLTTTRVCS